MIAYVLLVIILAITAGLFMPSPPSIKRVIRAGEKLTAQITMMGKVMHRSSMSIDDFNKNAVALGEAVRKSGVEIKTKGK